MRGSEASNILQQNMSGGAVIGKFYKWSTMRKVKYENTHQQK
jgi:hypothetical protein